MKLKLRALFRAIVRFYDQLTPTSPGLSRPGQWRVEYKPCPQVPQMHWSRKVTYDTAVNLQQLYGGTVIHVRYVDPYKFAQDAISMSEHKTKNA